MKAIPADRGNRVVCPKTDSVKRLTVEAGSYLGVDVGETIPANEVRLQAEANGYGTEEAQELLARDGISSGDSVRVPFRGDQGQLFGDLWKLPDTDRFRNWLSEREYRGTSNGERVTHSFSWIKAKKRYARLCGVDRYFARHFEAFSTILISLTANRKQGESLVGHARRLMPKPVHRKRRRVIRDLDPERVAGVRILAPKSLPADRCPSPEPSIGPSRTVPHTHAHVGLWIEGEVSAEDFDGVRDLHIRRVDGSTDELNPPEDAVSVKTHSIDRSIHNDETVTGLPGELGRNLPTLADDVEFDIRGRPEDYIKRWAAQIRLGSDGSLSTCGLRRWHPLGEFGKLAKTAYQSEYVGQT